MKKRALVLAAVVSLAAAGVVYAQDVLARVEVIVANHFTLNIDGTDRTLPEGQYIFNYDGRVYLPFRFVAELMGAEIDFDGENNRVYMTSPEPVVVEVEVPVAIPKPEEEAAPEVEVTVERTFFELPVKQRIREVTFTVFGLDRGSDHTAVYFDIDSTLFFGEIFVEFADAFIETDQGRFEANLHQLGWVSSRGGFNMHEDEMLLFDRAETTQSRMTVVIPVRFSTDSPSARPHLFRFPIDFSNMNI